MRSYVATDQINQECIKISLFGDINFQYINLKIYIHKVINPNLEPYNAQQASGRLLHDPTDNKLFFGVGDFKLPFTQDQPGEYGKLFLLIY